jgi:hypothetical protein
VSCLSAQAKTDLDSRPPSNILTRSQA